MSIVADPVQPARRPNAAPPARPSPLRINVNLTRELAVTSFKLKYTGSTLGYAWSLVKPLLIFGMTYAVFVQVLKAGSNDPSFPVELLLGIVLWTFFADATSSAVGAIVASGHMIRKAYFPRWIVVVAATLSATMTLAVNLALVLVIGLPLGWFHVGVQTLLVPLLFVELYMLVVGVGMLMSALFVFYRDLGHVWEITLQLLFYASAILFPLTLITRHFRFAVMNPIAQIMEDMRRALITSSIPWSSTILGSLVVVPCLIVCAALVVGYLVFHRLSPRFAEAL
ncbi:MAG: ABC transporter permease [Candidatus Dormibacter sp.]